MPGSVLGFTKTARKKAGSGQPEPKPHGKTILDQEMSLLFAKKVTVCGVMSIDRCVLLCGMAKQVLKAWLEQLRTIRLKGEGQLDQALKDLSLFKAFAITLAPGGALPSLPLLKKEREEAMADVAAMAEEAKSVAASRKV